MSTKYKIKSFFSYFKREKFRVLQIYPLKMNLVLEIQKRHGFKKRNKNKILIIIST